MTANKQFRNLRIELNERKLEPTEPYVSGAETGKAGEHELDVSLSQSLKHVRQFMKHPVAGEHQFNGSRDAVGIDTPEGHDDFKGGLTAAQSSVDAQLNTEGIHPVTVTKKKKKRVEKSSHNIDETDLAEGLYEDISKISRGSKDGEIKLDDGTIIEIDSESAGALVKVHESLNKSNQTKFVKNIARNETSFLKMIDFALEKTGS